MVPETPEEREGQKEHLGGTGRKSELVCCESARCVCGRGEVIAEPRQALLTHLP